MKKNNGFTNESNNMNQTKENMKRIQDLYRQMISTTAGDKEYRGKLCMEILSIQKEDGSFSLIDNYRCDSDIRVSYVYYPTYFCTAALIYMANEDGMDENLQKSLKKGLIFSAGRKLTGHGYEAVDGQLEALKIYKDAGLYTWLRKNSRECTEFEKMIRTIIETYRVRLSSGKTVDGWNKDYALAFRQEVTDYEKEMTPKVWYAAYGSNINEERFMNYISDCEDTTRPEESRAIIIPHNIYFSYKSRRWGRKGVAFLDDTKPGRSLGKMYLISRSQLESIQRNEGSIYRKRVFLGMESGTPIYTFTSPTKRTDLVSPGEDYLETILVGLKETYPGHTELVLSTYLFGSGAMNDDDRQILRYLREAKHGVTVNDIVANTVAATRVKASIKKLASYKMIKQDGRSAATGCEITDGDAVVYTVKQRRELIDLLLLHIR